MSASEFRYVSSLSRPLLLGNAFGLEMVCFVFLVVFKFSVTLCSAASSYSSRGVFQIGIANDEGNLRTFLQSVPNNNIVMGTTVGDIYSGVHLGRWLLCLMFVWSQS